MNAEQFTLVDFICAEDRPDDGRSFAALFRAAAFPYNRWLFLEHSKEKMP